MHDGSIEKTLTIERRSDRNVELSVGFLLLPSENNPHVSRFEIREFTNVVRCKICFNIESGVVECGEKPLEYRCKTKETKIELIQINLG